MLLVGGLAFGGFAIANAENQPAPTPVTAVTTVAPAPVQEPVVSEPAVEPAPVETVAPVEVAPVVAEPVAPVVVEPAPVYVAPEPVYVAPAAPAPIVDGNGYITNGTVPSNGGGPGKIDLPTAGK